MTFKFSTKLDTERWAPGMKTLLYVPDWLFGRHVIAYIMRHRWCYWLILWPLVKVNDLIGRSPDNG